MDPKITNNALIILTLFILLHSALVGRQARFKCYSQLYHYISQDQNQTPCQ